jgi:hypothetical protein
MKSWLKISFAFFLLLAVIIPCNAQKYYKTGKLVSTESDEIAPVLLGNKLVYISNRPVPGPVSGSDMQNRPFFKIYESELKLGKTKVEVEPRQMFDPAVLSDFHDGPVSFNGNGDFMAFSRCFDAKATGRDTSKFGLYFADYQNGSWGNIQEFSFNDRTSNTVYPAFNKDASVLYFCSDREGGFGGYDIYVSRYKNGMFTVPENLGPAINTAMDERYPFIHSSGRLYFSTEGHDGGIEKYDLFYSEMYKGKWLAPVKLPPPFNSPGNDYTFYTDDKFEKAYYSSKKGRNGIDIFWYISTLPDFDVCQEQKLNNYCFIFFEENTVELDTTLYQYEWNLGDNTKVRAMEAKHCFVGPGNYQVSLNVIDKLTKEVLFSQAEYEMALEKIVQAFITCQDVVNAGEIINLNGLESNFGEKDPTKFTYYWDFGNSLDKGNGASVNYTFRKPGTYTVKLKAIENKPKPKEVPDEFCSFKEIVVTEN